MWKSLLQTDLSDQHIETWCQKNDVNSLNGQGQSILYAAIARRRWTSVRQLVKFGADLDVQDENRRTPLIFALHKELTGTSWMTNEPPFADFTTLCALVSAKSVNFIDKSDTSALLLA